MFATATPLRRLMHRRSALFGLCCACVMARASSAMPALSTIEVAPGVRVRRGQDSDVAADNDDAIANLAFVIGTECVAVIDPGGCLADGQRLRAHIATLTDRPIGYVILSHVHPDHVFGAAAFLPDSPVFVGHASLPRALAERGTFYRSGLEQVLGVGRAGDVVVPDRLIAGREHIDLGGRVLEMRAHGVAHTDCDLSVLDIATGTWFAGDLLFVERVPSLDGSLSGWIDALQAVQGAGFARAVPGHGPACVAWPGDSAPLLRYLRLLRSGIAGLIAKGGRIEDAPQTAESERPNWRLFDAYHGRNAIEAFRELEWE